MLVARLLRKHAAHCARTHRPNVAIYIPQAHLPLTRSQAQYPKPTSRKTLSQLVCQGIVKGLPVGASPCCEVPGAEEEDQPPRQC